MFCRGVNRRYKDGALSCYTGDVNDGFAAGAVCPALEEVGDGELCCADGMREVDVYQGKAVLVSFIAAWSAAWRSPKVAPVLSRSVICILCSITWVVEESQRTGSNTPAPGQTISISPNSFSATSNILSSCAQTVTFVSWKTAREVFPAYWSTKAWASGRRARSAIRTLHPFSSSCFAKLRLIPILHI